MIQVVTGKLGAGKTLFAVMLLFDALCKGRIVVTNIAVNWDELVLLAARKRGVQLDESQLIRINPETDRDFHRKIPFGIVAAAIEVFLDEIHLFFNARDWAKTNQNDRSLLSFLSQSRKARVNITFITQEIKNLDSQFRSMAEWELYAVNIDHLPLGILGKLPFKAFVVLQRDANTGHLVKRIWRGYDKRYFRLYGSFTFLDAEMNEIFAAAEKREPLKLVRVAWWRRLWLNFLDMFRRSPAKA